MATLVGLLCVRLTVAVCFSGYSAEQLPVTFGYVIPWLPYPRFSGYSAEQLPVTEALLKFVESLDEEEARTMREGLDEETLALFDLLTKPELSTKDRNRLKEVAKELLAKLKAEKLRIDQWREKETMQSEVKMFIYDFLYNDKTGLPVDVYTEDDVKRKSETVFNYVFQQYPSAVSPAYSP